MKNIDRRTTNSLVILMVCYIGFRVLGYLIVPLKTAFLTHNTNDVDIVKNIITAIELVSFYGFNIVTGLVLIGLSKNVGFHKVLWFFMGSVFGFSALVIFFILELRAQSENGKD